jgi:hypothetical protein
LKKELTYSSCWMINHIVYKLICFLFTWYWTFAIQNRLTYHNSLYINNHYI